MSQHQPAFISEAGPAVYDALLSAAGDPLRLDNTDVPVVDTKTYLSSLLALALGRESVFFSKQGQVRTFKAALPKMRISGYSRDVLQGLEGRCLECGGMLWDLREFVQSTYAKQPTKCRVALASAIQQVVQVVQEWISVDGRNPRSLLRLQSTINDVSAILSLFHALISQLRRASTDEDIMMLVFHQAYAVDFGEEYLREIMRHVLSRVSGPWVEFMEEWIGTRREGGVPLTKSQLGASKGFVRVEAKVFLDDFGREMDSVEFCLDSSKIPQFMPSEVVESMFETGRNLRFIRSFHPNHPLAQSDTIQASMPPKAEWQYDWDAILHLESRVVEYRDNLLTAIQESQSPSMTKPLSAEQNSVFQFRFFGVDEASLEERIRASIDQFNQPVAKSAPEDLLGQIIRARLCDSENVQNNNAISRPHWSLLPVLSFGALASAQAQVVNQESLRLLFTAHALRDHLALQREFQLLGNGMFCSLLSHALFDPDLESAERRPGVAMQGGVMGLRLGGRKTWPPASSEMRLALMGVLAESYRSQHGTKLEKSGGFYNDGSDLPGELSFAVRDLSLEEIDKCMDPDSLEALDFLRLSYTAPPELTAIITPANLMQYDRIFKLLLRVLRMLYVVNQLFRNTNTRTHQWYDAGDAHYRFVKEAHHFVSSIASFFLDTGVSMPWRALEAKLDKIVSALGNPKRDHTSDKLPSPDQLGEFHSVILDRIMMALFLRKRQLPVLQLLEEIFATILQFAKHSRLHALGLEDDDARDTTDDAAVLLYDEFRKRMQVFVTVCRSLSEKGRRAADRRAEAEKAFTEEYGTGDESMIGQLLVKLDMYDYYMKR